MFSSILKLAINLIDIHFKRRDHVLRKPPIVAFTLRNFQVTYCNIHDIYIQSCLGKSKTLEEKVFWAQNVRFYLFTMFVLNTLHSVICLVDRAWFEGRFKKYVGPKQNKFEGATYEEMWKGNPVGAHVENRLETECGMLDLFFHRHPEGDRFIVQRKP
jgi:hypothetical protein